MANNKTNRKLKAKKKNVPLKPSKAQTERELKAAWDKLLASHSKPLERGLQAKGTTEQKEKYADVDPSSTLTLTPHRVYDRQTVKLPSMVTPGGHTSKYGVRMYTGTLIKGIAVMHKSNAVPILNDEDAKAVASMRR